MADGDQTKKGDSGHFRRFQDKALAVAGPLVLVLVGAVWAITWGQTRSDVKDVRVDVEKREETQGKKDEAQWQIIRALDDYQKTTDRRVTTLEAQQSENGRVFKRVEEQQAKTESKIDKLNEKIDLILREVRK